jgi:LemA protein
MKKWLIPVGIILVIVFALYSWVKNFNNTAISLNENIKESWGNVETAYQRRSDLIGNLVNTVKGAADFERSTLEAVVNARARATQTTIDPTNITPEQLQAFQQAQGNLNSALSRLLVTVEQYPDLKANQNFIKLQDELTSTENQILTARTRFNEAVKPYNNHVLKFPNSILAGFFNFKEKAYFESVQGAEVAPDVEFNFQ